MASPLPKQEPPVRRRERSGGVRLRGLRLLLAPLVPLLVVCSPGAGDSEGAAETREAAGSSAVGSPRLGDGFVVWESNRTGDWRIWHRRLDGSDLRQLTPEEGDRQHCCPHISPDGRTVVYLSGQPAARDRFPEGGPIGPLRRIGVDGTGDRVLVPEARTYGDDRAAVWTGERELAFIGPSGHTELLDLETGERRRITRDGLDEYGRLVNATFTHATTALPTFSILDRESGAVAERTAYGGCEPYFSHDGRWGFWIAGAGGPVHKIDLATREVSVVLAKEDPRLPAGASYVYFPMLARSGLLLAFAASGDEHDHFRSDYEVYVAETDPESLEIVGKPVRMTSHPGTDRFPDVYVAPPPGGRRAVAHPVPPPPPPRLEPAGWPVRRDDLAFLWRTGDAPNLVFDQAIDMDRACTVEAGGRARLDHAFRMVLGEGRFTADRDAAAHVAWRCGATNEVTLEATLTPARAAQGEGGAPAWIVSYGRGPGARNLALGQLGEALVLRLRTPSTGKDADRPQLELFELAAGRPTHLVVSYRPGLLRAFRDGELALETEAIQGGLDHWRNYPLVFGDGAAGGRAWAGLLEGVAIYERALGAEAARETFRRYRAMAAARPEVPRVELRARLAARSRTPTLDEISPYRRALFVLEYEVERVLRGSYDRPRIRVARWAILDGETQPAAAARPGQRVRLSVEPFAANPQLESVYLADSLAPAGRLPLYYAVE